MLRWAAHPFIFLEFIRPLTRKQNSRCQTLHHSSQGFPSTQRSITSTYRFFTYKLEWLEDIKLWLVWTQGQLWLQLKMGDQRGWTFTSGHFVIHYRSKGQRPAPEEAMSSCRAHVFISSSESPFEDTSCSPVSAQKVKKEGSLKSS